MDIIQNIPCVVMSVIVAGVNKAMNPAITSMNTIVNTKGTNSTMTALNNLFILFGF